MSRPARARPPAARHALALLGALLALSTSRVAGAKADDLDAIVTSTVRSNYEALHGCYRRALARDRSKGGTLFVRATLGAADAVRAVKAERDELKSPEAVSCILTWMRGWTFKGATTAGADAGSEIIVPLTFRAAPRQFAVRRDDAPAIKLGATATARVLLSEKSAGARQASLALLDVEGKLALPGKAGVDQALYVLHGRGTLVSLAGGGSRKLRLGSAIWIPADAKVVIAGTMRLVQLFVPGGLEQEYAAGREPILGARPAACVLAKPGESRAVVLAGGTLRVTPLLQRKRIVHGRFYLGLIEAKSGASLAQHGHAREAELLYVIFGAASATVDGLTEETAAGTALYLPGGSRHAMRALKDLQALQLLAPAGSEQRLLGAP
jgi:quercetin dioxygenase-like cupin family protein